MALTKSAEIRKIVDFGAIDRPVSGGAITIFEGSLCAFDAAKNIAVGADTAGFEFAGVSNQEIKQDASVVAGDNKVNLIPKGSNVLVRMKQVTALVATDIDKTVFLEDDEFVDISATAQNIVVGIIRVVESPLFALVQI